MKETLKDLYYGSNRQAQKFRLVLLAFDIITILFFIVSSMAGEGIVILVLDFAIAAILLLELIARTIIANRPGRFLIRFSSVADLVVIFSLLAPVFFDNLAFLRVVRMLRLLRSYHMLRALRDQSRWFQKNEHIIQSSVNLAIFVFVITAVIYVLEAGRNDQINNYLDALYFTVATLTTTGFGDITVQDTLGRMVTVVIMVFGVALFLRLVQTIFKPPKVKHECETCGLNRHEPDAVHCKHCGQQLDIPTDGEWA